MNFLWVLVSISVPLWTHILLSTGWGHCCQTSGYGALALYTLPHQFPTWAALFFQQRHDRSVHWATSVPVLSCSALPRASALRVQHCGPLHGRHAHHIPPPSTRPSRVLPAPSLSVAMGFGPLWTLEIWLSWGLTKLIVTELWLSSFRRTLVLESVSDEAAMLAAGVRHAF